MKGKRAGASIAMCDSPGCVRQNHVDRHGAGAHVGKDGSVWLTGVIDLAGWPVDDTEVISWQKSKRQKVTTAKQSVLDTSDD